MSKALRIAIDEAPREMFHDIARVSNWHPFYATMCGDTPPCYKEFMKAMECRSSSSSLNCHKEYLMLMQCLKGCGFD